MDQVQVIRHKVLVEGRRIRAVAREMRVSRNTVRKYLGEPEPVRKAARAKPRPVTEAVKPLVDELLEQWAGRTTPKQRITATRIHRELVEGGTAVGLTTVSEILREKRRAAQEVYVPLVHYPGDEAQVDFFEVTVEVAGERRRAWKFVMRLMYSGRDFAWLYDRLDQVAFLDGHVRAFAYFGSVPRRCLYDNLAAAVRKVVFPHRELTARFRALVSHYLFEPCFARPGEGHDKGGVEARGRGMRLQHLVPVPRGETLGAIAAELLASIERQAERQHDRDGKTILERFAEERGAMQVLPERPFEARRVVLVEVSRRALVRLEGAVYSVPSRWQGLEATAYVGPEDVRIVCRDEVETYARERFGGKRIRYRHYLPELARKPQALRQVVPELLGELGEPYRELWRLLVDEHGPHDGARVLARVLAAVVDHGEDAVGRAIGRALAAGRLGILPLEPGEPRATRIAVPESLHGYQVEATRAAVYDALLAEASHE
jgi:transposase